MGDAAPSVVVVGSGLAGWGVLRELRRLSPEAKLTLVTGEEGHFYSKPALSTAFAKGKTAETLITSNADKMIAQLKLDARLGRQAESIDQKRAAGNGFDPARHKINERFLFHAHQSFIRAKPQITRVIIDQIADAVARQSAVERGADFPASIFQMRQTVTGSADSLAIVSR